LTGGSVILLPIILISIYAANSNELGGPIM